MRTISSLTICVLASTALAQTPVLVKDIYPGIFSGILSTPDAVVIGSTLYFTAGVSFDEELWKSDGTPAGTVLVKDINIGTGTSFQEFRTVFKDELYFTAETPDLGSELWRTDDTEGAVLAAGDACLGTCSGAFYGSADRHLAEYNGNLYFRLETAGSGTEVWRTDGTPTGTLLFKDIHPGLGSSYPSAFTVFNGKLYFAADSANVGAELWVSDGTSAGTHLLKDINSNPYQSSDLQSPVVGTDAFYFWAKNNSSAGPELWKSDGTAVGTAQLKEIGPGNASGQPPSVPLSNSVWLGNKLLFTANDGVAGAELWVTDGTESETQILFDINAGSAGSNLSFLTTWNGKAYFRAKTADKGNELWVSDGTINGTQILKDINPGAGDGVSPISSSPFIPLEFIVHEDKMYFTANNGSTGYELWVTDGTTAGTQIVYDLNPGNSKSDPSNYQLIGDFLYFFATTQATGTELWKLFVGTSAAKDLGHDLFLLVYPTYSYDGVFSFDYNDETGETFDVSVFDAVGRLKYHANQSLIEPLRLLNLPAGSYFIRIAAEDGKFVTKKVIIGK